MTSRLLGLAAIAAAGLTAACAVETNPVEDAAPAGTTVLEAPPDTPPGRNPTQPVARVIDGDTIEMADGTRVRLIGVDTPERGDCGYDVAAETLTGLISGQPVVLTRGAEDDEDRYGRLLRYVDLADGRDAGYELLRSGSAVARYDSRDGYGAHDREADYIAADEQAPQVCDYAGAG